jgi:hypothetical protein
MRVLTLRRGVYVFLRDRAGTVWSHTHDGETLGRPVPPELERITPYPKRMRAHARQEAERLRSAVVYQLDAALTARAVELGARIREGVLPRVVEEVAPNALDTLGITPPSPAGFVLYDDPHGVGYSKIGAPLTVVHWGALAKRRGTWMGFWYDSAMWLRYYKDDAMKDPRTQSLGWGRYTVTWLSQSGPLMQDTADMISPHGENPEVLFQPWDDPAECAPAVEQIALVHTVLATWELLTTPGLTDLREVPPDEEEAVLTRAQGLPVIPAILASAPVEAAP